MINSHNLIAAGVALLFAVLVALLLHGLILIGVHYVGPDRTLRLIPGFVAGMTASMSFRRLARGGTK